ncbi:hypothetical protein DFJ58DRAFT_727008 [Suillus subalutaceus]|uniref:uncharacterized protein n=1 Tax=Suillus subalutaceus TaxID=48586 RepID=UPI001B87FCD8|nr:uncharacterized protein DFJ58DRAFT_727008 [Suillus subalutaceus]KAG1856989.1 hypothetical protein DFJ58DRAFT_727008 [Suillus subalutaceus]
MPSPPSHEEDAAEEEEWEREATSTLETLGSVHVEDGPTADHAFHLDLRMETSIPNHQIELNNASLKFSNEAAGYRMITHFFAHLCLYLRMIDIPVLPFAFQVILEAYLQVLVAADQKKLIAIYAGAEEDNAVERHTMFLTSLELTPDIDERRLALTRAREHGLSVHRVEVVTAERRIDRAFEGLLPSVIALQATPSDIELLLLRSIEWTTFEDGTYDTALEQATVILRAGRVSLAKNLVEMLPRELASIDQPEERAT